MISSDHIEPGASGQIRATVDTAGHSGRLEKQIVVYSNDANNPVITLSLGMDIIQK